VCLTQVLRLEWRDGQQRADLEARGAKAHECAQGDAAQPSLAIWVVQEGGNLQGVSRTERRGHLSAEWSTRFQQRDGA
jgi:hypothetical protein